MTEYELRYAYEVKSVEKITDGDTYWLHLDVGFRQSMLCHIRLYGWDTPEFRRGSDYEKTQALAAKDLVEAFFRECFKAEAGDTVWVQTQKDPDNFGRWLGAIWRESDEVQLGQLLEGSNLATPWPTRWRDVYDTDV